MVSVDRAHGSGLLVGHREARHGTIDYSHKGFDDFEELYCHL